jgi:hypothetical protein
MRMTRPLLLSFAGLAAVPVVARADEPKSELPSAEARAAFKAELKALTDKFNAEAKALGAKGRRDSKPILDYVTKFQDLAERAKGTDAGLAAHTWVIERLRFVDGGESAVGTSLDAVVSDYSESAALEPLAQKLAQFRYRTKAMTALRAIIEKSPHESVRAAASFSLATLLQSAPKVVDEEMAEARTLLETVAKGETRYASMAKNKLFELDHLAVGKVAPDFEATDQDDQTFKLSDYRGKVVVLDFWGFW